MTVLSEEPFPLSKLDSAPIDTLAAEASAVWSMSFAMRADRI
jgi:hypothetical protein